MRWARGLVVALLAGTAMLVPISPASADSPGWIVQCQYSHEATDDPLVFPGQAGASHLHDFFGNRSTNASSTYSSMVAAHALCSDPLDTAGYWTPALYKDGTRVLPTGTSVTGRSTRQRFYYRKAGSDGVAPFPPGFTMIIGNAHATSAAQAPDLGKRIYWGCADNSGPSKSPVPVDCPGTGIITLHFDFPSCWDGTYTSFVNEAPQMVYPSSGACPSGYTKLPRLIERLEWPVGTSTGTITLASGPYFTAHADFVNTWRQDRLEQLTSACLNTNTDCGVLPGSAPAPGPAPSNPNRAPTAADDAATTTLGAPVSIDVLANDSDPDGQQLRIHSVATPANGTAEITGAGTPDPADDRIRYTPGAGFSGTDVFTYDVTDGIAVSRASISVAVSGSTGPPVARYDAVTVLEDSTGTAIDVLSNDSDPDGDPITITGIGNPSKGTAWVDTNATPSVPSDDRVGYSPQPNAFGADSFTYTISDGKGGTASAPVDVTITPVNDPPDAVDDAATVAANSTGNPIPVLANDTIAPDVGETLAITSLGLPSNGTGWVDTNGTAGTGDDFVRYSPAAGFSGSDSFTYTVSDGNGGTDTATIRVTISPPPPAATNLVGNPGFETNLTGWGSSGSGVVLERVAGGRSSSWAARIRNSGSSSVTMKLDDKPNWVSVSATGTYTISLWARADAPGAELTMKIREYASGSQVASKSVKPILTTSWQLVTMTYAAARPGASTLDLTTYITGGANASFMVDDVSIVRG